MSAPKAALPAEIRRLRPQLPSREDHPVFRLKERAEAIRRGVDLLNIDDQVARVSAIVDMQWELYAMKVDNHFAVIEALEEIGFGSPESIAKWKEEHGEDSKPPSINWYYENFPQMALGDVEKLASMIKMSYDMKFAKRFSVPVEEVETMRAQIKVAFQRVAQRFNLPKEVTLAFIEEISAIRVSKEFDAVLATAGGATPIIDGEWVEAAD
jgi:hypothetical protein